MYIGSGVLFPFCALVYSAFGTRMPSCINGLLIINEKFSTNAIQCDQIAITTLVTWSLKGPLHITLGECETNDICNPSTPDDFNLIRSGGNSTLIIAYSAYRTIGSSSISCVAKGDSVEATCDLNVVYPPDQQNMTCAASFSSDNWTLSLSCEVTKTYSSRDIYFCIAYRGTTQSSQTILIGNLTYSTTALSQTPYKQGTCSFSINKLGGVTSLPSDSQLYIRVDVYPGPTSVVIKPISIVRPVVPTITCPAFVEENTPFTCNCSTTTIGQPPGRLQWSGPTSVSATGNYGDKSLNTPSLTLTRQDHGTSLICEVMWADGPYRQNYTANVGFKAENLKLMINSAVQYNVTVNENENVTFTCQADARPVATVELENENGPPYSSQSPLVHTLGLAQCDHTGRYTCSASNMFRQSNNVTKQLFVYCSPRSITTNLGDLNYQNRSTQINFSVTAYPVPSSFFFTYTGPNGTDTPQVTTNIDLSANCKLVSEFIRSKCFIIVSNVTSPSAQGYYIVSVGNSAGQQNYTFQVLYNGPTPSPLSPNVEPNGINAGAVGGGIGGAVVVLIVVIVIVIFVLRRNKASPDRERLNGSLKTDNGNHNKTQAPVNPPEQPLSFTPCALQNAGDQQHETHQKAEHTPYSSSDQHKKPQKTKPTDKAKLKKKNKGANEDAVHVYGNMPLTQQKMKQQPPQDSAAGKPKPKTEGDGLIYSELDFQGKPSAQPPVHKDSETVIYSDIKASVTVNAHNA